jgi:isoleucyl-tRNA synthetase
MAEDFESLLNLRARIMQAVESAQKSKTIGTTLEARVVVRVSEDKELRVVRKYRTELDELFVISDLTVEEAATFSVEVTKTSNARCERCWRYREDVPGNAGEASLCGRCAKALLEATGVPAA